MSHDLTPTDVCERLIGPPETIAAIAQVAAKAPYNWRRLGARFRLAGDLPSAVTMRRLLEHSDRHQLGLTADHLIRGASEAEVAAIEAARPMPQVAAE